MAMYLPDISGRTGPKYRRIVDAIAADIASGRLPPGTRLPPHRILAWELGISPNTTARAYAEGVERALLRGEVGRGTYVRLAPPPLPGGDAADLSRPDQGRVDLSRNLPCPGGSGRHLARTMPALSGAPDLQAFLDFQTGDGLAHHLQAGCDWLSRTGVAATPGETVITCGAQHGILAALMAVTRPGDLLLTESLTYAPVRAMAESLGLHLHTLEMDDEGLIPDALAAACSSRAPKALYLTPTLQTPTTITLTEARRRAIVALADQYDVLLIEDDVYGMLKTDGPARLASLAPDRTVYISSCSKGLAPGLRVAFVRAPEALAPALRHAVTLSCWMPPPLMVEIACRWMADGTADELIHDQQAEAARRQAMAAAILKGQTMVADAQGFHLWLTLPRGWEADAFCAWAREAGVRVSDGAVFAAERRFRPNALRISLGCEPSRQRVERGLEIVAGLLEGPGPASTLVL